MASKSLKNIQVAKNIKEIRRRKKLTQAEFARLLELSQSAIKNFEGGRVPHVSILKKIADIGGTTVDQLLSGSGDNEPARPTPYTEDHLAPRDQKLVEFRNQIQIIYASPYFEMYLDLASQINELLSKGGEQAYEAIRQVFQLAGASLREEKTEKRIRKLKPRPS